MKKNFYINCPHCKEMMEIDGEEGRIVKSWKAQDASQSTDEKLSSALKKIDQDKKKRATLFEDAKNQIENQKKKMESSFQKEVERIKKEGLPEAKEDPFKWD